MLVDNEILKLIDDGIIENANQNAVGTVCYDISTKCFCNRTDRSIGEISLEHGDSIFVESNEIINLPNNLVCKVHLRNSRIRQGLSIDAPIYYPGHKTRVYYRVTNVSGDTIELDTAKGIASITFERLESQPNAPYCGTFQSEMEFADMGNYSDVYSKQIKRIDKKREDIEKLEHKIYGSVITILTIFVAVFSLINVNISIVAGANFSLSALIIFDLATVACISVLFALMHLLLRRGSKRLVFVPIGISCLFFAASIVFRLIIN